MSQAYDPNQQLPPAGWYPDPNAPDQQRYWDGAGWTTQTHASNTYQPVQPAQPQDTYQQAQYQPAQYQQTYVPAGPLTADGVPLAGWWSRVGATIIDGLLMTALTAIVSIPFYDRLIAGLQLFIQDAMVIAQSGVGVPDYTAEKYGIMGPYWSITLISIACSFVYSVGLQSWRSGTLGQLALGLRVVPIDRGREHHGLALGTALLRNVAYQALAAIGIVWLINVLIPLGHPKRQTLHDMIARTQVVKIR